MLLAGINKTDDMFVSPSTVDAIGAISSIGSIFTVFVAQMAV